MRISHHKVRFGLLMSTGYGSEKAPNTSFQPTVTRGGFGLPQREPCIQSAVMGKSLPEALVPNFHKR